MNLRKIMLCALIGPLALMITSFVCSAQAQETTPEKAPIKKEQPGRKTKKGSRAEKQPQPVEAESFMIAPEPAPARPANGSLFTSETQGGDLLSDFKPRRIGDLVFVDVIEGSTASVSSSAKRARDSGSVGGLVNLAGAIPLSGADVAAGVITAMGTRKYEGKGSTDRSSTLRTRIAARVIEVLPNGDLRIQAQKSVRINQENEKLVLSGIIRQRDVSAENVIPTTSVGNLYVELNGKGVASADNAPGWLFRLFEKIAPF